MRLIMYLRVDRQQTVGMFLVKRGRKEGVATAIVVIDSALHAVAESEEEGMVRVRRGCSPAEGCA
jgi:hypothetical protein